MKKITLLAVLILSGIFASASELRLRIFDNAEFSLQFDAINYESNYGEVLVRKIFAGSHYLKVTRNTVYFQNGKKFYSKEIIFDNYVYIKDKSVIISIINDNREFIVERVRPLMNESPAYPPKHNHNGPKNTKPNNTHNVNTNGGDNYYNHNNNQNNNNHNNPRPGFTKEEFARFMGVIKAESFDNTKLTLAKDAIRANGIITPQLVELLEEFSFESTKLELAKFAYEFTFDKDNYYVVNNAFSFSSSKEELSRFIGGGH